jgi:hypothetical protein
MLGGGLAAALSAAPARGRVMSLRTLRCTIEEVAGWYPKLFLEPYIVACVTVMSRYSGSPASFGVECEGIDSRWLAGAERFRLQVSWTEMTAEKAERLRATMPSEEVVELASVALAFVLARRVLGLRQLVVTNRGDRADYRAPAASRVVEVSGTETVSELGRRHREKVVQALRNPFGWSAYVVACGFATAEHRIRSSGHAWEESGHAEDER